MFINQLIKIKRKTKVNREQEFSQQNIQSQADANTQTQQAAAQAEVQKQQQINESKIALEEAKSQFEQLEMQKEAMLKKELILCPADYPYLYSKIENSSIFLGEKNHWRSIKETLCTFLTSKTLVILLFPQGFQDRR